MANKHRGEVALEVDGKAYKLRYSTNKLCELETVTEIPEATEVFARLFSMAGAGRINSTLLRACLWAAVSEDQPEITLQAAGKIIDLLGETEALEKISELVTVTYPAPVKGEGTENPK